jgi:hypothetical protein
VTSAQTLLHMLAAIPGIETHVRLERSWLGFLFPTLRHKSSAAKIDIAGHVELSILFARRRN